MDKGFKLLEDEYEAIQGYHMGSDEIEKETIK